MAGMTTWAAIGRVGLVGHAGREGRRRDAERQLRGDVGHGLHDVLAQGEDVAAVAHGDREADGWLAVDTKHRLRRIGKGAPDLSDVAEAEHASAGGEVDVEHILLGSKRA